MDRSKTWGVLCLGFVLATVIACDDRGSWGESQSTAQQALQMQSVAAPNDEGPSGGSGAAVFTDLRLRHQYKHRSHSQSSTIDHGPTVPHGPGGTKQFLAAGRAQHLASNSLGITPMFLRPHATENTARSTAEVVLPQTADAPFRVLDRNSAVHVEARLLGARSVGAEVSDGVVLYPQASAAGGTVVQRPTEFGTEDFVELTTRAERPEVGYEFRMLDGIAGLRLVGNTLEFIDVTGSPSLRVAPPSLVTAQGERVGVTIAVEGCAVDRDARPPWGRTPVAPGASTCVLRLNWDDSRVSYPALLDPAWVTTGSLATARSGATAAVLPNGLVLIAGGVAADWWSCLDSAELYNPATRSFAATGSMTTARCRHSAVRRANGQVMVAGGVQGDSAGAELASTELYDAANGTWKLGAPLSVAHADHQAVLLNTGDVLLAGGTSNTSERLLSASSTWSSAGSLIASAAAHTLTVLADGRVLLVGGSQAQLYVPSSNNWYRAPTPIANFHQGHTATRLSNGQVLVVGEQNPSTELFEPKSNTWARTGSALSARSGHTATRLSDGRVLVAGGLDYNAPSDLSAEVYDPSWGTFSSGSGLVTSRNGHVSVPLASGRVLVAGGIDPDYETLSSAEEFDPGALNSVISEYRLAAKVDSAVLSDRITELWASVTRPATLANGQKYPLLIFLHGNHATCGYGTNPRSDDSCQYTESGTCPSGYVVTPNHRGYDYITKPLAARGYIVVSINANRGITCGWGGVGDGGLNLARGRLILRHLEELSAWNRNASATPASVGISLAGRLDLTQVGMLGHSRGGEGVRAAYQQYRDAGSVWPSRIVDPVTFRGLFEIGPVDGQTSRVLNAEGTRWNVLLPMCDGDVSDLEGVRPFDRMMNTYSPPSAGLLSTYTVWGANHNFYNTEWQETDSYGCTDHRALFSTDSGAIGSAEQRQTALRSVSEFFLANVGKAPIPTLEALFNPERYIEFDSPIERGYGAGQTPATVQMLEDFTRSAGISSYNIPNSHSRITVAHETPREHDPMQRAANIRWTAGGTSTYFQTNFAANGAGLNLTRYQLLDFRIGRAEDELNVAPTTDVSVQLVNADNSLSSGMSVSDVHGALIGPVGGPGGIHQMLSTVRMPLASFASANLRAIRGVRFTFSTTPTGAIYLANVRATRSTLADAGKSGKVGVAATFAVAKTASRAAANAANAVTRGVRPSSRARRIETGNSVVSLRTTASGTGVAISLSSDTAFAVRGDLLVLDIGGQQAVLSQHPQGDLRRVVFTIGKAAFDAAKSGERLIVHYRRGVTDSWDFGVFDKNRLDQ